MTFYKYLIYRIYEWRLKSKDEMAGFTTVCTLIISHGAQITTIAFWYFAIQGLKFTRSNIPKIAVLIIVGLSVFILYRIFYNKERWESYAQMFQGESRNKRKWGTIKVILFTAGSVILLLGSFLIYALFFAENAPSGYNLEINRK